MFPKEAELPSQLVIIEHTFGAQWYKRTFSAAWFSTNSHFYTLTGSSASLSSSFLSAWPDFVLTLRNLHFETVRASYHYAPFIFANKFPISQMADAAPAPLKAIGSIKADVVKPPPIYTKYRLEIVYKFEEGGDDQKAFLNINADVAIKPFTAETLAVVYKDAADDFTGFARFRGNIGGGKISFALDSGMKVTGAIEGGPKESQSFVGTGTFTAS